MLTGLFTTAIMVVVYVLFGAKEAKEFKSVLDDINPRG